MWHGETSRVLSIGGAFWAEWRTSKPKDNGFEWEPVYNGLSGNGVLIKRKCTSNETPLLLFDTKKKVLVALKLLLLVLCREPGSARTI